MIKIQPPQKNGREGIDIELWKKRKDAHKKIYRSGVYVLQGIRTGVIKIGKSGDIPQRIKVLATASSEPLDLLTVFKNEREHAVHKRFAKYNLYGEWFEPALEILEWVKQNENYIAEKLGVS